MDGKKPGPPTPFDRFLAALLRVPKIEIDRLEAERPKKAKRKKPDAA